MGEAEHAIPSDLSLILVLKEISENFRIRCFFNSEAQSTIEQKQQLEQLEKSGNNDPPIEQKQPEKSGLTEPSYSVVDMTSDQVTEIIRNIPEELRDMGYIQIKDNNKVFFIGNIPVGLGIFTDNTNSYYGVNWYMCLKCGRTLKRTPSMLAHAYNHIGLKQFVCALCGKQYSYKTGVGRHMMQIHNTTYTGHIAPPVQSVPQVSSEEFLQPPKLSAADTRKKCRSCSKKFKTQKSLTYHINTVHSSVHNFQCHYCSQGFYYKKDYNSHMKREYKLLGLFYNDKENIIPLA